MATLMGPNVLQLRIELLGITPLIWRRLQILDSATFWDLHVAIQDAMGWNDTHLHEFEVVPVSGKVIRIGMPGSDDELTAPERRPLKGWESKLSDYLTSPGQDFVYTYDFGDDWRHLLMLEQVQPMPAGSRFPKCVAGERASPPDDSGGPHSYPDFLEQILNRNHPEHSETLRWAKSIKRIKGKYDPEFFDERTVRFSDPAPRLRQLLAAIAEGRY